MLNFVTSVSLDIWRVERCNLHMKFSALNVDFSNSSLDPLDSQRPVHVGVKERFSS